MTPYHGRKPRDGRRENKSGWTGPQPAVTGGKRQPPAPDYGAHVGEVIDQVSDAARHQDTADSDGLSAGVVALPKMAGRTNLGALGRAVCSSRAGISLTTRFTGVMVLSAAPRACGPGARVVSGPVRASALS